MVRSCSSTSENKAVINSTVIIRLSSPGKDVTESSVEESSDDCKSKNVHYEFLQFYTRCVVCKRLTPLVTMSASDVLQSVVSMRPYLHYVRFGEPGFIVCAIESGVS